MAQIGDCLARIGEPSLQLGDACLQFREPCLSFRIPGRFHSIPGNTIAGSGWERPKKLAFLDEPCSACFIANSGKPSAFDCPEHRSLATTACLSSLGKCERHAGSPEWR